MTTGREDLLAHLATGATTVCQCWSVARRDGVTLGFTDHDRDLTFEAITFKAASGLTARALQQGTGLAVDNTEALGALSDAAVSESDLASGLFDGAAVTNWLVNWQDNYQRMIQFRGYFGEVTRSSGSFRAELRGLSEALNQVHGQTYQRTCSAVLGDARCKFNLNSSGFSIEAPVTEIAEGSVYMVGSHASIADGWFQRGRAVVLDGPAVGAIGLIKFDREAGLQRRLELWVDFPRKPLVGDTIRFEAGCDKVAAICQKKFSNFMNFRGFPHIPGEDWVTSYPVSGKVNDGGSLFK